MLNRFIISMGKGMSSGVKKKEEEEKKKGLGMLRLKDRGFSRTCSWQKRLSLESF